jgi:membrane protease YdiL (CAAX protease family)
MKTLIRVIGFYVIAFIFTIILSIVQQASGIDAEKIVLPQFGPGLAAVAMILLFRKDDVKITIVHARIPFQKYIGSLGIPFLVSIILFLLYSVFVRPLHVAFNDIASILVLLGGMVLGAFGEELGWRGYLQNLLNKRTNGFVAFLLVGILWGLWHVGNYQNGPLYMLFFILSTIGYSAVMAALFQGTDYSVILACLFHFSVNAGFYMLKDAIADLRVIALNAVLWTSAAIVISVRNRKEFLWFRKESVDKELR